MDTFRSNDRHIETQTDLTTGLTRLDRQSNRTEMTDQKEKIKNPRFAFLKISTTTHCTHLQSRTCHLESNALQKSAILPTL